MSDNAKMREEIQLQWDEDCKRYKEIGHYKDVGQSSIEFERFFKDIQKVKVQISQIPSFNEEGSLSFNQNGFFFIDLPVEGLVHDMKIFKITFDVILYFEDGNCIESSDCFFITNSLQAFFQGRGQILLNGLVSRSSSDYRYFRSIIPIPNNIDLSWDFLISSHSFLEKNQTSRSIHTLGLIEFTYEDLKFQIFIITNDKDSPYRKCIFIDCLDQVEIKTFTSKTKLIMLSIGFFTCADFSYFNSFTVASNNKEFREVIFDSTRVTNLLGSRMALPPLIASIGAVTDSEEQYREWSEKSKQVSIETVVNLIKELEVNTFCDKIIRDMLINCSSISELKVTQLFTSIEAAKKWDRREDSRKPEFVIDRRNKRQIIKELEAVINDSKNETCLSPDFKKIIINKLPDLFRIPNSMELEVSFVENGIELKEYEKRIISSRNLFLHGEVRISTDLLPGDKNEINHLIFYQNVMISLLYRFILKKVKYDGLVLNVNKIQFPDNELFKEEPLFFSL